MFYAGIDVAMDKHACVILDANGKCFIEVFTFKNSRDGFEQLMSELKSLTRYRATLVADCSSKRVKALLLPRNSLAFSFIW
ncbi:IS110 family transposase [Mageeibacillus indolicus]|uniref:IS110 family transposase n=1 Tax=Mageeibacillus indolicus TaxID=884684 RepID=UPI0004DD4CD3|nr:transposase [Mageeibacillus indolicus]KFA57367.1 hypothetical protein HMPREF1632_04255 [Mageeibacillus indolicus 0009-5]